MPAYGACAQELARKSQKHGSLKSKQEDVKILFSNKITFRSFQARPKALNTVKLFFKRLKNSPVTNFIQRVACGDGKMPFCIMV